MFFTGVPCICSIYNAVCAADHLALRGIGGLVRRTCFSCSKVLAVGSAPPYFSLCAQQPVCNSHRGKRQTVPPKLHHAENGGHECVCVCVCARASYNTACAQCIPSDLHHHLKLHHRSITVSHISRHVHTALPSSPPPGAAPAWPPRRGPLGSARRLHRRWCVGQALLLLLRYKCYRYYPYCFLIYGIPCLQGARAGCIIGACI